MQDPPPLHGKCHFKCSYFCNLPLRKLDWCDPGMWRWQIGELQVAGGSWDLFIKPNIWPKEVPLASRTQPSGPLCLWQCFYNHCIYRCIVINTTRETFSALSSKCFDLFVLQRGLIFVSLVSSCPRGPLSDPGPLWFTNISSLLW